MEAAAKQVRLLTQRILPEHPHHLSYSPDKRYRAVPDAKGFEEQIHRGLQYMTFVSDGDRGVLLTRPYYEMREEPPVPEAQAAATPSSRSEKKPSTKMSLSDYKNKVKQQSQSPLPPNPTLKRATDEHNSRPLPERRHDSSQSDSRKRESLPVLKEHRIPGSKDSLLSARPSSLPPKPPPVLPNPSPGARKRGSDEDDGSRPLKRSKPDLNGSTHDRSRLTKDVPRTNNDISRRRDAPPNQTNDRSPRPEHRQATTTSSSANSSSTVNGRGMLKAAMNQPSGGSPNARPRAGSTNGVRPGSSSGSHSTSANKLAPPSSSSKTGVPPLLSPLHLSFNDSQSSVSKKTEKAEKTDRSEKAEKAPRREEKSDHHHAMAKSRSADRPPPLLKKTSPSYSIPPLLSPTLPPIIEAELLRRKKASPKEYDLPSPEPVKEPIKPIKKSTASKPERDRFIVTLRFSKKLGKGIQRLMALPGKNERSGSMDPPSQSQASKKRPIPTSHVSEVPRDTPSPSASKRPRKVETATSTRPPAPSTPSRSSAGISHVNTPGEAGSTGPSSQGGSHPPPISAPSVNKLRHLSDRYGSFGKKLKRARDGIFKSFNINSAAAAQQIPESDQKLAVVTGIEAILAFMVGFKALCEIRRAERKTPDPTPWKSLLPMVGELQRHARAYHFVHTLLWMLQDTILQEILACYYLMDLRIPANAQEVQRMGGLQVSYRRQLPALYRQVEEEEGGYDLRLPALNPGVSVEEIVYQSLRAAKSWADGEDVDWQATLSGEEVLAGN